jgi:hypothetical protein
LKPVSPLTPALVLAAPALIVGCSGPSREELEAACSPEFLQQYDEVALEASYAPLVEAAEAYGVEEAAPQEEASVCLDYKEAFEARQEGYDRLAGQVARAAGGRVDGLRWVTYEVIAPADQMGPIADGWLTYMAVSLGFVSGGTVYSDADGSCELEYTPGAGWFLERQSGDMCRFTLGYPSAPVDNVTPRGEAR